MRIRQWLGQGQDAFGLVLGGSLLVLIIAPFELHSIRPAIVLLVGAMATFTLWTAGASTRVVAVVGLLLAAAVALTVAAELRLPDRAARIAFSVITVCIVLVVITVLITRIASHPRVGVKTICGALAIYVLVGLVFTYVFVFWAEAADRDFFTQPGPHTPVAFLYFSYATLTTVGYGDLSAGNDPARMIAVLEALIGQLYLVSVVALVIGNLGRVNRRSAAKAPADAEHRALT